MTKLHEGADPGSRALTTPDPPGQVRFERVTGTIGALVHGVELGGTEPATSAESLSRALHEFGVLFFEFDHLVSAPEFVAFAELFGEPEESYRLTVAAGEAPCIDSDLVPMKDVRVNCWHTDGTALEVPPQAALLTPVELPEVGGDTMWASMYAAWEGLSSHYQRLLDGLEVRHGTTRLPFLDQSASAIHPAVIRDPVTGRKMLFVNSNWSERIMGMTDGESEALLRMLFDHVNTPEFHVRLRWRPGVVAVWEERVTQHRGVADFVGPRKLRRLTLVGVRPAA
jgi:taurine dioxygenase